jgi:hypothetical protein
MAQCYVSAPDRDPALLDELLQCASMTPEGVDVNGDGALIYIIDSCNPGVNVAAATFMWWRVRMELEAAFARYVCERVCVLW